MNFYAGIGSRRTPLDVMARMTEIAVFMRQQGYTLRSGGAPGADTAFEAGAGNDKKIYLPWKLFNNNPSPLYAAAYDAQALEIAAKYHPRWNTLTRAVQTIMARNCYQVLGGDLKTPSEFIVCWTPTGKTEGGTGQAMRIARDYGIPIYNIFFKTQEIDALNRVRARLF